MTRPEKTAASEFAEVLIDYLEAWRLATPESRAEAMEQLRRVKQECEAEQRQQ